jgi:hypothetical protein
MLDFTSEGKSNYRHQQKRHEERKRKDTTVPDEMRYFLLRHQEYSV